jgi:hypothetical protein
LLPLRVRAFGPQSGHITEAVREATNAFVVVMVLYRDGSTGAWKTLPSLYTFLECGRAKVCGTIPRNMAANHLHAQNIDSRLLEFY